MSATPPAIVIGGVSCEIYHGDGKGEEGIRESLTSDGPHATVKLICAWTDRYKVVKGLGGTATGTTSITRIPPFKYPDSPNMRCVAISDISGIKFAKRADGWGTYTRAVLTAEFGILPYGVDASDPATVSDPSGVPYSTTRFHVNGEVLHLPAGVMKFTDGPDSGKVITDTSENLTLSHMEISLTRHMMPYVPVFESMYFVGSLNLNPVKIGNKTFPKGYILYLGMNATQTVDSAGSITYEVEYNFLCNEDHDFNETLDSTVAWVLINTKVDKTGEFPFNYFDWWNGLP